MPEDMLLLSGIEVGKDLDIERLEQLRQQAEQRLALMKAAGFVSRRAMSKRELEDKLLRKGEDRETAAAAALYMEELGAINEEEYAKSIVRTYSNKGYGPGRVKEELRKRGVPRALWQECLEEMPDPEEAIDRYITSHVKDVTDEKLLKRTADALYRRGFQWSDIKSGLRRAADMEFTED